MSATAIRRRPAVQQASGPAIVSAPTKTRKLTDLSPKEQEAFGSPAGFARLFLRLELYPKQEEILNSFGPTGAAVSARTCNESGKTTRLIAPLILWHASVFPRGIAISTSGSWGQVTHQLVPRLKYFAHRFPRWAFNEDTVTCNGLPRWVGFSTNNAGRAEGYHGSPEEPLLALVDEAKTVKDDIFESIDRCNPQRMGLFSSPGYAEGEFYRSHTTKAGHYKTFKIAAAECPHITKESIARRIEKYGEKHPLVRSMIFAEFMEMVEGAVLSLAQLEACLESPPNLVRSDVRHCFCDFAAGGDENVVAVSQGNKVWIADAWRDRDTMSAVGRFVTNFERLKREIGLRPQEIEGDADGLGKPMLDAIREAGWPVMDFHGGEPALFDTHYKNRATEVWFEGAKKIAGRAVILPRDEELNAQLIDRKSRYHSSGCLWIESKEDMRKRNVGSPDRADAVLGALASLPMARSFNLVEVASGWERQEEMEVDQSVLAGFNGGDY